MHSFQIFSLFFSCLFGWQLYRFVFIGTDLFQCTGFPAVQVMGDVVAIAAFGETGQHTCRMWRAMATLTGRDRLVLVFVTCYAVDALMFCVGLAVKLKGLLVA